MCRCLFFSCAYQHILRLSRFRINFFVSNFLEFVLFSPTVFAGVWVIFFAFTANYTPQDWIIGYKLLQIKHTHTHSFQSIFYCQPVFDQATAGTKKCLSYTKPLWWYMFVWTLLCVTDHLLLSLLLSIYLASCWWSYLKCTICTKPMYLHSNPDNGFVRLKTGFGCSYTWWLSLDWILVIRMLTDDDVLTLAILTSTAQRHKKLLCCWIQFINL